jgi:hypothetical protein
VQFRLRTAYHTPTIFAPKLIQVNRIQKSMLFS